MSPIRIDYSRRRGFVTLGLMLALLASSLAYTAQPTAAQGNACPPADNPVDANDPAIVVDTPQPGDSVDSPVPISGEAGVFEANVLITIFDADGNELANTFTTAASAAPGLHPFSTQVVFNVTRTQDGCIWVFEEDAAEGGARNVVAIPVTLNAGEVPPGPAPTGDAGIGADAPVLVLVLTIFAAAWVVIAARVSTGARETR